MYTAFEFLMLLCYFSMSLTINRDWNNQCALGPLDQGRWGLKQKKVTTTPLFLGWGAFKIAQFDLSAVFQVIVADVNNRNCF